MKYPEVDLLCSHMSELVGAQIARFMRIHVWVDREEVELLDTILIECVKDSSSRTLQIFTDAHRQWSTWLDTPASYTIDGSWDDRESEALKPALGLNAPIVPDVVCAVLDVDCVSKQEHLIGFLFGVDGAIALALNVHLDDIELTDPARFWRYVDKILPYTERIEIVRLTPRLQNDHTGELACEEVVDRYATTADGLPNVRGVGTFHEEG